MKNYFAILALAASIACHDGGPTASSSFGPNGLPQPTLQEPTSSVTNEPVIPPATEPDNGTPVSDCFASLGINRNGIRHSVSGLTLSVFVPATNADYVRVWTPYINDTPLGQGPVNEEFTVVLPAYGEYKITLAIERRNGDGTVCQYDGHSFSINTQPPPPPPRRDPDPNPKDVCPNIEGNQSEVPDGLVKDEQGNCVEPEPECEQVWVIDQEAYDETVVIKQAYDELVCVPGEPIITGYAYKLTGGGPETRKFRCEVEKGGSYESSASIPGDGVVDACIFNNYPGSDDFLVGIFNPKTRFRLYTEITKEGEPICEIIHHDEVTEIIHHDEIGHFEQVCNER